MILPLTFAFGIAVVIGGVLLIGGIAHVVFAFQTHGLGGASPKKFIFREMSALESFRI